MRLAILLVWYCRWFGGGVGTETASFMEYEATHCYAKQQHGSSITV